MRELQNAIERAAILEEGDLITSASFPPGMLERPHSEAVMGPSKNAVREFERESITRIIQATDRDEQLAVEPLGVSVSSIYRRFQDVVDENTD